MKTYEQKTQSVFDRIEEEKEIRRIRNRKITRVVVPALSLCLVTVLGLSVWQNDVFQKLPDTAIAGGSDSGAYISDLDGNDYAKEESESISQESINANEKRASTVDDDSSSEVKDAPADANGEIYEEQTAYPDDIMDLQIKISEDMTAGKLPFVTSSSIVENPLRLEICVNTQDSKLIDKVKAYDPNGKYITIVQSGIGVEE